MKRTLAITATTAMLALSLAACGAERNGDVELPRDLDGTNGEFGTTATDTMRNDTAMNGTGTYSGATANTDTVNGGENTANTGLGGVAGAAGRGFASYGANGYAANGSYAVSGNYTGTEGHRNASTYTAANDGVVRGTVDYTNDAAVRRAARNGDNYAMMLENGRVHDRDGYLLDGENASYRTF